MAETSEIYLHTLRFIIVVAISVIFSFIFTNISFANPTEVTHPQGETAHYPITEIEPGKEAIVKLTIRRNSKEILLTEAKGFGTCENMGYYFIKYKKGNKYETAYPKNGLIDENYTIKFTLEKTWASKFQELGVKEFCIKDIEITNPNDKFHPFLTDATFRIKGEQSNPTEAPQFEEAKNVEALGLSFDRKTRWRILDIHNQMGSVARSYFSKHIILIPIQMKLVPHV